MIQYDLKATGQLVPQDVPQSAIVVAIKALQLAVECGGELDQPVYRDALTRLAEMQARVLAYAKRMEDSESVPEGNDYNELLSLIGFAVGAGQSVATPAQQSAAPDRIIRHAASLALHEPLFLVTVHAIGEDTTTIALGATYLSASTEEEANGRAKTSLWRADLDAANFQPKFEAVRVCLRATTEVESANEPWVAAVRGADGRVSVDTP